MARSSDVKRFAGDYNTGRSACDKDLLPCESGTTGTASDPEQGLVLMVRIHSRLVASGGAAFYISCPRDPGKKPAIRA